MSASTPVSIGTTHERPSGRREQEPLAPFPRRLPGNALPPRSAKWGGMATSPTMGVVRLAFFPSTGRCRRPGTGAAWQALSVWARGQLHAQLAKRPLSQTHVEHPDQFRNVETAASRTSASVPLGPSAVQRQRVQTRSLSEYDQLMWPGGAGMQLS